ncbi:MAG: fused MFS/spermidine synthase [Chitinispirillales bacterium]|jgi:spermidine synthase|nr:fused MFS/spermidine synthase [Chitinispirillales bacterium]
MRNNSYASGKISPISYLYFTLFFISGISGLIYESIWSQYLKQFLGHAAYAQTLVLVIYMGGMAAGSWLAAVWAGKARDLLLWYAVVEIALGALALAFHGIFVRYIDVSFSAVIPFLGKPALISLYKWVTASLIILPQSMLLGATFPLMAGGILRRFPGLSGYKSSFIYFVNTFGASIGVLISGFYLVREWGLKGAIISGGAIDLFVGASILALCLNGKSAAKPASANNCVDDANSGGAAGTAGDTPEFDVVNAPSTGQNTFVAPGKRAVYYPLLFVAGATATASFIYEIGWIRMLSLVLGSSTHSFELMLSAFILGLALGSFFVRNKLDRIKNAPRFLGIAQIAMGACAVATLFIYGGLFNVMVLTIDGLDRNASGHVFFNIISHLICMAMMLPATVCAGMVIPLIIHMLYARGYGEASIGKVYAVNTAGGILGVVVAVWALMELVGLRYLIIIGGVIDMGIGLYVLYHFAETREGMTRTAALLASALVLFVALPFSKVDPALASSGVFRYGTISKPKRIVGHKDGKTASITLFKSGKSIVLSTNGKPDASVGLTEEYSSDEYTMALLGVLPMSVREEMRTAAVIGMGAGMTAHYMLYDPTLEKLDVVEIERAVPALAKKIGPKVENTFKDARCRIHIEDAKTFFSAQNRSYDVIVSEPSNPWVSGVSSLFSREFFHQIRRHINDGGILVQWFHKYEADITILASILKALGEAFPAYELYLVDSDLIIIAAKDEGTDIGIKRDVFANAHIAENLSKMGFSGIDELRMLYYANKAFFGPLAGSYPTPPNSDYHSFVDLYAAKHRFMGSSVKEINDIREFIIPTRKIIFGDTAYLSLTPRQILPDIYNYIEVQQAKTLAQELILNASASGEDTAAGPLSASIFILDYTAARPNKVTFPQIQSAITQILQKTLPYLSASEMRELWGIIEDKVARKTLSSTQREWMDYFGALCSYDIAETRRLSLKLLPADADTISGHFSNQMLIASLLATSVAAGDTSNIEQIWEKYEERKEPPAAIRAVRAMMDR